MASWRIAPAMAWRYLRARKSHSAVTAIARVSVAGVAVATAAIVCVLSVFNGFREVLAGRLDLMSPDVMVSPASGKTFADGDSLAASIRTVDGVAVAMPMVADNALALAGSSEMPVRLLGVDPAAYRRITSLDSIMLDGGKAPLPGSREAAAAVGTASQLALYEQGTPILLFAPRREGRVNLANPAASFISDSVALSGVYRADRSEVDANTMVCDIEVARMLFQYDAEATEVLVKAAPDVAPETLAGRIRDRLGKGYVVKDRLQQQAMDFRMIEIEKWVTFLLLFFILVIASFNIVSTLAMLVVEKQKSMLVMRAVGMPYSLIGRVFWWESVFVTVAGGIAGLALGVILSLLQEHFGLIKLAGDPSAMIVSAYPVALQWGDVVLAFVPVALIGLAAAWVASRFARTRARSVA